MSTQSVTMTEFKHNLGEYVNRVAYSDHRVLLMSHGKARAALIGLEDLERLEATENQRTSSQQHQALLAEARAWREQLRRAGISTNAEGLNYELWTADQRLYNSVKDDLGRVRWISQAPISVEADALSAMATLGSSDDPQGSVEHDRDIDDD